MSSGAMGCGAAARSPTSCFGTVPAGDPGAQALSSLFYQGARGRLPDGASGISVVSNLVSYAMVRAMTECAVSFQGDQRISLNCDPTKAAAVYNNPNCEMCVEGVSHVLRRRAALEEEAARLNPPLATSALQGPFRDGPRGRFDVARADLLPDTAARPEAARPYAGLFSPDGTTPYSKLFPGRTPPSLLATPAAASPADPSEAELRQALKVGVCAPACFQCILLDLSQNMRLRVQATCDVAGAAFQSAYKTALDQNTIREIERNQQALRDQGYTIQSGEDVKSLAISVSNTISQITTTEMLQSLFAGALALQSIEVEPGSTSVMASNVKQTLDVSVMATLVRRFVESNEFTRGFGYSEGDPSSAAFVAAQSRDSTGDVLTGAARAAQTFSDVIDDATGQLVFAGALALVAVAAIFAGFLYYKRNKDASQLSVDRALAERLQNLQAVRGAQG